MKGEKQKSYYKNDDNDGRGPYLLTPLHAKSGSESGIFEHKFKNGQIWKPPKGTYPRFSKETLKRLEEEGRIWLDPKGKKVPQRKTYLSEVSERMPLWTFWRYEDFGSTRQSNQELSEIIGKGQFQNPKPTKLIKIIIDAVVDENGIVLDFFAGSGTTGQAVLETNKEDGGNRQFILCTNDEEIGNNGETIKHKICSDICYPRLKKVIKGYKNGKGENVAGLGGNLKYYTCAFVEAEPTDRNKRKLVNESTEMLCIRENAFELVQDESDFKIFKNSDKYLGIVFYEDAIDDFKKAIENIKGHFYTYVFSLSDDPHEKQFADVKSKVTLCAIPEVILKVYREIFK